MLISEFLSKLLFFFLWEWALINHFQLSLNRKWAWWIWIIVLSFTLGGLVEDNPLLGETRPNTTSLISLQRPCCFVAAESHAQLSATALSPWWRRVSPIVNSHLHCPLIDFTESGGDSSLYLQSDTPRVSAVSVSSCPLEVPQFPANWRQSWSRQEWFWHFLSPHSRSTPWGSCRQCRWIWTLKHLLSSLLPSIK